MAFPRVCLIAGAAVARAWITERSITLPRCPDMQARRRQS